MLLSGEADRRWQAEDARSVERGVGEQEEENRHQQQNLLRHDRGEHALQRSSMMNKNAAVATRILLSGDKKRAASIYDVNVKL